MPNPRHRIHQKREEKRAGGARESEDGDADQSLVDTQMQKRTDSGSCPVSVPTGEVDRGSAVGRQNVKEDMRSRLGDKRRAPRAV